MKLTKTKLTEIIKEVLNETDGHPQILKKNKEVPHNWATHMEWKSSTYKKKYGDVIGEVKHHTLFEDGSITNYDVQFGNKLVKSIPADKLNAIKIQEHSHEATEDEDDELDELGPIGMAVGRAVGKAVAGAALNKAKDKLMSQKDGEEEEDDE